MPVLTTEEIDRELDSLTREVAAMSATLVELDSHPGLVHIRTYPPTGVTAQRWAAAEKSPAQLWDDLGRMTSILQSARAVRARRSKPDDDDRRELTRLLREPTLEVSRQPIPLAKRQIGEAGEAVEYVGLADTADRMHDAYPGVVEFLDAVERVDSLVAEGLTPTRQLLDAAAVPGPDGIAALLEISATDPLSLTAAEIEQRIESIAADVERDSAELAELAAIQSNWPSAVAATAASIDTLRDAVASAMRIREQAVATVLAGSFPQRRDEETELRHALQSLASPDPRSLLALRCRIKAALKAAREEEALAQGLLDRRTELKGRLTAYQAKAARLGLGEDRDLLSAGAIAAGLLSRRPCDLRAVTRAISDFQQMIADKRETTR